MDNLLPFLYQFIGGGIVLSAGFVGAIRSGAFDPSSSEDRKWFYLIIAAVLVHFILQGFFQFLV